MKAAMVTILLTGLLLGVAACGDSGEKAAHSAGAAPQPEIIRGLYTFGHEVRALRPCGEDDDLWVIDPTQTLSRVHGQLVESLPSDVRIFVIATGETGPAPAEGFGADFPGSVTIDEVIYAALEGFRCDFDLSGFLYRASGNEPFWMAEIQPGAMRLSRPGMPDLTWPAVAREHRGDLEVWRGVGGPQAGVLIIHPEPGYDSMSGAYHHHRVRFELEGSILEGVALRGAAPLQEKSLD